MAFEKREVYYDADREEYIDKETGQVLQGLQSHPIFFKKRTYSGPNYIYLMQNNLKHIASLEIKPASMRVFLWMAGSMEFGNEIKVAQTTIAQELDLAKPTVSRAISELVEESLIVKHQKIGTSWIYKLNAHLGWKGNFAKREQTAKAHPTLFPDSRGEA